MARVGPLLPGWVEVRAPRPAAGDSGGGGGGGGGEQQRERLLVPAEAVGTAEGRERHLRSLVAATLHVLAQVGGAGGGGEAANCLLK